MSAQPKHYWTEEEYLAFEEASDTRHEYLEGEIYDMVGGTSNHNLIATSVSFSLYGQLRNRPCMVYVSDMRVKVKKATYYTYPDISVVCGDPLFAGKSHVTLLNPTVIIEILSTSTKSFDRGKKFDYYRQLESLQSYLLIAQDSPHIEQYTRQGDAGWLFSETSGLNQHVEIPVIECSLLLADVYEKVDFSEIA